MGKRTVAPVGFIHGRFQVLHNDHLVYLLAGIERCEHLVVGVSNPDPTLTRKDEADSARSSPEANPLTYYERYLMVRAALAGAGLRADEYSVVPFPVNFPELYRYYVPMDAVFYLTIYDSWGEKKLSMFTELGLATEVLWRRSREEKGLSSTEIRRRIAAGEEWTHLVPPAVVSLLETFNIRCRLAKTD
ncbi:nicotinate-nucleotide adenylyltransferase [Desulfolithobacter sp.]